MKKISIMILLITCLSLQGCAYELGYAAGTMSRYAGAGVRV